MRTKKFILEGIGNEGKFNFYIFDKKQDIIEKLAKIIQDIFKSIWPYNEVYDKKKKEFVIKQNWIKYYKDKHEFIGGGKNSRIDVFYGDKKIFLTINCSQKLRLKFNNELFKIAIIPKGKKV